MKIWILRMPEEDVSEVIRVIRSGLDTNKGLISKDVFKSLNVWCANMELRLAGIEVWDYMG